MIRLALSILLMDTLLFPAFSSAQTVNIWDKNGGLTTGQNFTHSDGSQWFYLYGPDDTFTTGRVGTTGNVLIQQYGGKSNQAPAPSAIPNLGPKPLQIIEMQPGVIYDLD